MYKNMADYFEYIFPPNKKADFLLEEFREHENLLDIGCSDGKLAKMLYEKGHNVEALDIDENMIKVAKKNSRNIKSFNPKLIDMTEIDKYYKKEEFNGIYCIGNTIVHLESLKLIEESIGKFADILDKNGKIIIQIINYDYIYNNDIETLPTIENSIVSFKRSYTIEKDNIIFKTKLKIKGNNKEYNNNINLYPLRRSQLENILKNYGFTKFKYYGGFSKEKFNDNSMTLVVIAEY